MGKRLYFNHDARRLLQAGVDELANTVKVTLGPEGPQRRARAPHRARRRSPTTASRSRARSSCPTRSRTWARSSSARSPTRRATSPATAPPRPRCWPRRSCARACGRSTRAPTRCCCAAASRRPPRCVVAELQRAGARRSTAATTCAHVATIAAKEDEVIGDAVAEALRPRRRRGRGHDRGVRASPASPSTSSRACSSRTAGSRRTWCSDHAAHGDGLRGPATSS